jgi:hypothetical protein
MGITIFTCAYIGKKSVKIVFSRTSLPISIKFDKNYLCTKGIQVCTNKGPNPFQRGGNSKIKDRAGSFHIFFKNHWVRKAQICIKASWYGANWNLLKSWSSGVRWGHNWEKTFLRNLISEKISSAGQFQSGLVQITLAWRECKFL